jgi:hypothetical protein
VSGLESRSMRTAQPELSLAQGLGDSWEVTAQALGKMVRSELNGQKA